MSRRAVVLLTLATALTVLISPFGRDLFVGDETRYGQVVREMREGSLLVPTLNGNPYAHKPPLHFWIITALSFLFGPLSVWPFVLQSILAYFATILLVRHIGRRLFGEAAGDIAGLVMATMLLAWGTAQSARMDGSFVLLISLAVWWCWEYVEGQRGSTALIAAGAAVGTAILIKGPMALVLVAMVLLFERIRGGRLRGGRGWLWGFLVAAALPLIWLGPALFAGGAGYADELLIKQNVGRAVGSWVHRQPFWFYIPRFPLTYFPWFAAVLFAIAAVWKRQLDPADRSRRLFLVLWIAAVVVPFSLLSGKLDVYMLPALVPAAILTGAFLADPLSDWMERWTVWISRSVLVLMIALAAAVPLVAPSALEGKPEADLASDPRVIGFFVAMGVAAVAGLLISFMPRLRTALGTSTALALAATFSLTWLMATALPLLNEESSTARLVRALERSGVPPDEMALHRTPHLWARGMNPGLAAAQHVDAHELTHALAPDLPQLIVTRRDRAGELGDVLDAYERIDSMRMIGKEFDVWRRR